MFFLWLFIVITQYNDVMGWYFMYKMNFVIWKTKNKNILLVKEEFESLKHKYGYFDQFIML